ncbi:hypothetical protein HY792_01765, partial [Candidatus Desantisbacteria bacterium]|nr:hypothetical protein [Candidatus Desantisbacteria bacterium]
MRISYSITVVFIFLLMGSFVAQAQAVQRDEEIIERLIRLETQMTAMNTRINDLNIRIDDLKGDLKGDISD